MDISLLIFLLLLSLMFPQLIAIVAMLLIIEVADRL